MPIHSTVGDYQQGRIIDRLNISLDCDPDPFADAIFQRRLLGTIAA
jgi:hypothetical protein